MSIVSIVSTPTAPQPRHLVTGKATRFQPLSLVRVSPGVPKRTHLEPQVDNCQPLTESQPMSAEEFLAELRF